VSTLTALPELVSVASLATASVDNPKADFSDTPLWLSVVKALMIFVYLLLSTLLVIWFERRVIGRMQQRPGPNRNGPFGLLQTLADGMKSMLKEDVRPKLPLTSLVFTLAPIITATMCFVSFSIMPLAGEVSMFGHQTPLQLTDTPVAVLLVLAVAGVGIYGIVLAGWSSGSTYPLLGGLRSTAQMISYEIAMGLSLVAVFMYSRVDVDLARSSSDPTVQPWFALPAVPVFFVYLVTMVGETNRLPFDLAEGEGEIVGGFHTEYGSMRFAMFFLGEYINMFTVAALATTMFLGGPAGPPPASRRSATACSTRAGGACCGSPQAVDSSCSSSSGCVARCLACATTSSCASAGSSSSPDPRVGRARRLHPWRRNGWFGTRFGGLGRAQRSPRSR
jgi:NADH-quinone oxidoreductase subunit H